MMEMSGLISTGDYADKYNVGFKNVTSVLANRTKEPVVLRFGKGQKKENYIDLDKCRKRWDLRRRIWNEACDNYYAITEHISTAALGRLLGSCKYSNKTADSWTSFMFKDLFIIPEPENAHPLLYTTSKSLWQFWRITTRIRRVCEKYGEWRHKDIENRLPNSRLYSKIYSERLKNYEGAMR